MAHVLPEGVSAGEMKDSERASAAVLAPPSPLGRVGVGIGGAAEKEHAEWERLVFRRSHLHLGREEAFYRSCRLLAHERDEHAGVAEGGAAGGEVARGMAGGGAGGNRRLSRFPVRPLSRAKESPEGSDSAGGGGEEGDGGDGSSSYEGGGDGSSSYEGGGGDGGGGGGGGLRLRLGHPCLLRGDEHEFDWGARWGATPTRHARARVASLLTAGR